MEFGEILAWAAILGLIYFLLIWPLKIALQLLWVWLMGGFKR